MKNRCTATIALATAATLFTSSRHAVGGSLSLLQADAIVTSAMMDEDLVLPGLTQPAAVNQQASLDLALSASGWSGSMSGDYFGNSLAVNYIGDSSAFGSSGTISWTSTGLYGESAWAGFGTAVFTSTNLNNITGTFTSTLTIGSGTITYDETISGSDNSSTGLSLSVGGPGTVTVGSAPPNVISTLFLVEHAPSDTHFRSLLSAYIYASRNGLTNYGIGEDDTIYFVGKYRSPSSLPAEMNLYVETSSIPEPSSIVPAGFAVCCLALYLRLRNTSTAAVRVYFATEPADMRKSFDGLAAMASDRTPTSPFEDVAHRTLTSNLCSETEPSRNHAR